MLESNIGSTSVYFNSVCLTIVAFIFVVLVLIIYLKKEKVNGLSTKLFILCLVLNLVCIILEFIVPLCIKDILDNNYIEETIYSAICKIYISFALLWELVYLTYSVVKSHNLKFFYNEKTNRFNIYGLFMFIFFIACSIAFSAILKMDFQGGINNTPYTISGLIKLVFDIFTVVGSSYIILTFTIYSVKIKNINVLQFYFVFSFYLALLALDYFAEYHINHLAFVQSLITLTTYFSIESQDNQLLIDYNKAKEEAERANKLRNNFLVNMSHEIRTPMNTILGFGESIIDENNLSEESFKSDFDNITKSSNELLNLVNNISYISKLDSGSVELSNNDYNLMDLINSINSNIYPLAKTKNILFNIVYDPSIIATYEGDSKKIYEVLYYLITNALDQMYEGDIKLNVKGNKKDNEAEIEFILEHNGYFINNDLFDEELDILEMSNNIKNNNYNSNMKIIIIRLLVKLLNANIDITRKSSNETKYIFKIEQTIKNNNSNSNTRSSNVISRIIDRSNAGGERV